MLTIIPRKRAHQDLQEIITYYDHQAGEIVGSDFIHELEAAQDLVSNYPKIGSTRFCEKANLTNLRIWSVKRYPHQIFYRLEADRIDVWRILHSRRKCPLDRS